jgi:tetratricopeptide (TPR) repeat protein
MKKIALTLFATLLSLQTVFAASDRPFVVIEGKKVVVSTVKADANGNLTFKRGKMTSKKKVGSYDFAFVPYNKTILPKLDSKFKSAGPVAKLADYYKKAAKAYKFLSWGAYASTRAALCLKTAGKIDEAIQLLEEYNTDKLISKIEKNHVERAKVVLASLYLAKNDPKKADEIASKIISSEDSEAAAKALIVKGDIYDSKGAKLDAALSYLQVALLFPRGNPAREEALFKAVKDMQAMNDSARAKKFIEMLKSDYPSSKYLNEL